MPRGKRDCLVKKEKFRPTSCCHHVAPTVFVAARTDYPGLIRPTFAQQCLGSRIVDDAAVTHEHPALRDCNDVTEWCDAILKWHRSSEELADTAQFEFF